MHKGKMTTGVSDSVSSRVIKVLKGVSSKKFSGFTLAELIVVVTILAILAVVGFLALSGYTQDASDAKAKTNVRSLYSAISAESAVTGNSPRWYVSHSADHALSGAYLYVDGNPVILTGGNVGELPSDSNYSAGTPRWDRLKLDGEKFRTSKISRDSRLISEISGIVPNASAANGIGGLTVGAADISAVSTNGRVRALSFFQVAGILPETGAVTVSGDFPTPSASDVSASESNGKPAILGLVRNPDAGPTDALSDSSSVSTQGGAGTKPLLNCAQTTSSGYSVPSLSDGTSSPVSKTGAVSNGTKMWNATASCSDGTISVSGEAASVSCVSGYVEGPSYSCIQDICGETISDINASSNATGQSVSTNWHYSATPGQCTWGCNSGYSWNNSSCVANGCDAASRTVNGRTYAVPAISSGTGTSMTIQIAVANGEKSYRQAFACALGTLSESGPEEDLGLTCDANYSVSGDSCVQMNSCATPEPSGSNYGVKTIGSPSSPNQPWIFSVTPGNCTYSCASPWLGLNCDLQNIYSQTLNHKFNAKILGQKLDITTGGGELLTDDNYIYNGYAHENLFRHDKDGTNKLQLTTFNVGSLQPYGNHLYFYDNTSAGTYYQNPFRINKDGTNLTNLNTSVKTSYLKVRNGYIFFLNANDSGKIYRMDLNGMNVIKLSDVVATQNYFELDDTHIYYKSGTGIAKMKHDGSGIITISSRGFWKLKVNSTKIVFLSGTCGTIGYCMYSINKDGSNEVYLSDSADNPNIDENNIYYTYYSAGYKLYKVGFDGSSKTLIKGDATAMTWGIDSNNVYVLSSGNYIYRINKENPELYFAYTMSDARYQSSQISTPTNNENIYVNVGATLPEGTSYAFEIANVLSNQIIFAESSLGTCASTNYRNTSSWTSVSSLFASGDEVIIYKGATEHTVTITSINSGLSRINYSPTISCSGTGWGMRKRNGNFKVIPNDKLNGSTVLNMQQELGSVTKDLYYKITLSSVEPTKSAAINTVSIIK